MALPLPVVTAEQWVQCDNPNCQKWRRLPKGATFDEEQPWYCYLNPDHNKNSCSASEVSYDEKTEFVIPDDWDAEEAAHNLLIKQQLAAGIAAGAKAKASAKSKSKGKSKSASKAKAGAGAKSEASGALQHERSVSFADEPWPDECEAADAAARALRPNRKQASRHCLRLLDNQGSWEAARAGAAADAAPAPPPAEAWEALAAAAPDLAGTACAAVDLTSSLRYFPEAGDTAQALAQEGADVARLALVLAAAAGAAATADVLTTDERRKLGLDVPG